MASFCSDPEKKASLLLYAFLLYVAGQIQLKNKLTFMYISVIAAELFCSVFTDSQKVLRMFWTLIERGRKPWVHMNKNEQLEFFSLSCRQKFQNLLLNTRERNFSYIYF